MPPTLFKYEISSGAPLAVLCEGNIEHNAGNGYVWLTTGSSKTPTCFKESRLPKLNEHIHRCLFVVDDNKLHLSALAA